jgi:flagellar biosynthesis/type III secretory pathway M-ring protein FliF/YscJ
MYTVYRTFREGTGQNVTLECESPAELRGKSWDVLEEICEPTVTPLQSTVTGSTTNNTTVSISQPDQFNSTTVQENVSVQESSPDAFHAPSTFVVIFVASLTVAVFIAVFVVNRAIRRLRRSTRQLNRLWWEDVVARKELMSD